MPLTNPNKVVTEERLSEFYGQILPYMGGMPDVLANKFSKGDLYSTDEKMIGQWIDGKPLYQKAFVLSESVRLRAGTQYTLDVGSTPIERIIQAFGIDNQTNFNNVCLPLFGVYENNTCGLLSCSSISNGTLIKIFVLQYTKTTDSAVSIGSDTDYSTDEKIVGTWIDGKPIYECTFSKSISLPSSRGYTNYQDLTSKNVDTVISMIGVWLDGTTTKQLGIGDTYPCNMTYDSADKYLKVLSSSVSASTPITVTIKYTKTTD